MTCFELLEVISIYVFRGSQSGQSGMTGSHPHQPQQPVHMQVSYISLLHEKLEPFLAHRFAAKNGAFPFFSMLMNGSAFSCNSEILQYYHTFALSLFDYSVLNQAWFRHVYFNCPTRVVAKWLRCLPLNQEVLGSSPGWVILKT